MAILTTTIKKAKQLKSDLRGIETTYMQSDFRNSQGVKIRP